jgi:hypothetical protein
MRDTQNPRYALQVMDEALLVAVAQGLVDLNALAKHELLSRRVSFAGLPVSGKAAELAEKTMPSVYAEAVPDEAAFEQFIERSNRAQALRS